MMMPAFAAAEVDGYLPEIQVCARAADRACLLFLQQLRRAFSQMPAHFLCGWAWPPCAPP